MAEAEAANTGGTLDLSFKPFVIVNTSEFLDLRNDDGVITNPWLDDKGHAEALSEEFTKNFNFDNYFRSAIFRCQAFTGYCAQHI